VFRAAVVRSWGGVGARDKEKAEARRWRVTTSGEIDQVVASLAVSLTPFSLMLNYCKIFYKNTYKYI
jgi:hypothetical protein